MATYNFTGANGDPLPTGLTANIPQIWLYPASEKNGVLHTIIKNIQRFKRKGK